MFMWGEHEPWNLLDILKFIKNYYIIFYVIEKYDEWLSNVEEKNGDKNFSRQCAKWKYLLIKNSLGMAKYHGHIDDSYFKY